MYPRAVMQDRIHRHQRELVGFFARRAPEAAEELAEDAAGGPDVDLRAVRLVLDEQLGRAPPAGADIVGKSAPPIVAFDHSGSGTRSKVSSANESVRMNATATRPATDPPSRPPTRPASAGGPRPPPPSAPPGGVHLAPAGGRPRRPRVPSLESASPIKRELP